MSKETRGKRETDQNHDSFIIEINLGIAILTSFHAADVRTQNRRKELKVQIIRY